MRSTLHSMGRMPPPSAQTMSLKVSTKCPWSDRMFRNCGTHASMEHAPSSSQRSVGSIYPGRVDGSAVPMAKCPGAHVTAGRVSLLYKHDILRALLESCRPHFAPQGENQHNHHPFIKIYPRRSIDGIICSRFPAYGERVNSALCVGRRS